MKMWSARSSGRAGDGVVVGVAGVRHLVGVVPTHSPSKPGSDLVEARDRSLGEGSRVVIVPIAVAVVRGALEPAVELAGDATLGPGDDVVDIAAGRRDVEPAGWWQERSRTSIARRSAPTNGRRRETETTVVGPSNHTVSSTASSMKGARWAGVMTVPLASSHSARSV